MLGLSGRAGGPGLQVNRRRSVQMVGRRQHFYSLDALNGDSALHGCLKEHGTWNAVSRDSHEYKREQIRQNLERVNGELEKPRGVTQ
jgi:hypothetical protein